VWEEFSESMLTLEKQCLMRGYPRAFTLAIGNCLAPFAEEHIRPCDYPSKARPTLEALGIELKETLEIVHWGGMLVRGEDEPMQLFGLLLLE
jgi:predicted metal-binding protein